MSQCRAQLCNDKDGVMAAFEPAIKLSPRELRIIGEVQVETHYIDLYHGGGCLCPWSIPSAAPGGRQSSDAVQPVGYLDGAVYEFSVYHLMVVEDPHPFVNIVVVDINSRKEPRIEGEEVGGQSVASLGENPVHSAPRSSPPVMKKVNNNSKSKYLSDVAKVIRPPKNAGQFELRLDVMFPTTSAHPYHKIKAADPLVFSAGVISGLYQMQRRDI